MEASEILAMGVDGGQWLGWGIFLGGGVSKKDEEEGRLVMRDVGCRSLTADLPPLRWRWRWKPGEELTPEKNQVWRRTNPAEEY